MECLKIPSCCYLTVLWVDWVQLDRSCLGSLTHWHLDVSWVAVIRGLTWAGCSRWFLHRAGNWWWPWAPLGLSTSDSRWLFHMAWAFRSMVVSVWSCSSPDTWLPKSSGTSPNSVCQRSHRACPDSREWNDRLYLLMGEWQGYIAEEHKWELL